MVLGISRDMFETMLTSTGPLIRVLRSRIAKDGVKKQPFLLVLTNCFNVFMLFFLIKAFKTVKTAIFRPHPSKSSIAKSESEDPRMSTWSQTCPGRSPKPFSTILDTSKTLIRGIWDDLKKVVDPPPLKKFPFL